MGIPRDKDIPQRNGLGGRSDVIGRKIAALGSNIKPIFRWIDCEHVWIVRDRLSVQDVTCCKVNGDEAIVFIAGDITYPAFRRDDEAMRVLATRKWVVRGYGFLRRINLREFVPRLNRHEQITACRIVTDIPDLSTRVDSCHEFVGYSIDRRYGRAQLVRDEYPPMAAVIGDPIRKNACPNPCKFFEASSVCYNKVATA